MSPWTNLLEQTDYQGYPFPYALARIRGRRAQRAMEGAAPPQAGYRGTGLSGRRWLWRLLGPNERAVCAPLFFVHEVKPITLALRRREARRRDEAAAIMGDSLLVPPLRRMVCDEQASQEETLAGIARFLSRRMTLFESLQGTAPPKDVADFEGRLVSIVLGHDAVQSLHATMCVFFIRLADMVNMLTLCRHLRWKSGAVPALVTGGSIGVSTLERWLRGEEERERMLVLAALAGDGAKGESPAEWEARLLEGMSRFCRRLSHDPDGFGLVTDYLWKLDLEDRRHWGPTERPDSGGQNGGTAP